MRSCSHSLERVAVEDRQKAEQRHSGELYTPVGRWGRESLQEEGRGVWVCVETGNFFYVPFSVTPSSPSLSPLSSHTHIHSPPPPHLIFILRRRRSPRRVSDYSRRLDFRLHTRRRRRRRTTRRWWYVRCVGRARARERTPSPARGKSRRQKRPAGILTPANVIYTPIGSILLNIIIMFTRNARQYRKSDVYKSPSGPKIFPLSLPPRF